MKNKLAVIDTILSGVKLIESNSIADNRGSFSRWFCLSELQEIIAGQEIRQINHSVNLSVGTVRGMHYRLTTAGQQSGEYKLVRCIRGRVHDVILDLRAGSATFGESFAVELSEDNQTMLLIPPGCAHGFQVLADNSQLLYLHTQDYEPELDAGVSVEDPQFAIQWPLPIINLSARDQSFPLYSVSAYEANL